MDDWKTIAAGNVVPGDVMQTRAKGEVVEGTVIEVDLVGRNRPYPKVRIAARIGERISEAFFAPDDSVKVRPT